MGVHVLDVLVRPVEAIPEGQGGELVEQIRITVAGSAGGTALVLAKLGLLANQPVCTSLKSRAGLEAMGIRVLDRPFVASGNVASAGGCLASPYLAAWVISRLVSREAAENALRIVAPVGEKAQYVASVLGVVSPLATANAERVA